MGAFGFISFRSNIVREQPISFVFFSIVKKNMILFVLKIIVHFPSIRSFSHRMLAQ